MRPHSGWSNGHTQVESAVFDPQACKTSKLRRISFPLTLFLMMIRAKRAFFRSFFGKQEKILVKNEKIHVKNLRIVCLHPGGRRMLTDEEFHAWVRRNQIDPSTEAVLSRIRSSPPSRRVRGRASNVSGRYPSVKMGRSIQFESQHVELWAI